MPADAVNARIYPAGILTPLRHMEVERLHDASRGNLAQLLHHCALAVLNNGIERLLDKPGAHFFPYHSPEISVTCNMSQRCCVTTPQGYI